MIHDLNISLNLKMTNYRDYLMDPSYWKMNWSKREQEINANIVNLKTLAID